MNNSPALLPDFWLTVLRTMLGRCPNCGEGWLFVSYLKPVPRCSVCGEALGHIRADDGPAWLTILLVGHILAPLLLEVVPRLSWPDWMIVSGVMVFALVITLCILPRAKGFFIGIIWRSGGLGQDPKEPV
ncbi:MAG: DUF983 domain-containing protein [Rickettsiales bacterium]|nr:DUF983 domain-containing protein [Rickettsiales bacterium]